MCFSILLLSITIFSAIILVLVGAILFVEHRLLKQGRFFITVNEGQKKLEASSGQTLLSALRDHNVYIPSGCGGKGTCGDCQCQVLEGAGRLLPIEAASISRKRQKEHYRLACQVRIREDVRIVLDQDIFNAVKFECRVVSNTWLTPYIKELVLQISEGMDWTYLPGQYVQFDIPEYRLAYKDLQMDAAVRDLWQAQGYLNYVVENEEPTDRGFSIFSHPSEVGVLRFNVRIALPPQDNPLVSPGVASSYLFALQANDRLPVSGPFGRFLIQENNREMVYIGGGVGLPSLRSHLYELFVVRKERSRRVSFWYGARSTSDLFYVDEFRLWQEQFPNFSYHVALSEAGTDDDWDGDQGYIGDVLYRNYLKEHPEPEEIDYYFCGPTAMNQAVVKMLDGLGVDESRMMVENYG